MYLQTNHKEIAAAVGPPTTLSLLNVIRPEAMLLRVTGKALILWDSVEPTHYWFRRQVSKGSDAALASHPYLF